jgi:hypothetical protein
LRRDYLLDRNRAVIGLIDLISRAIGIIPPGRLRMLLRVAAFWDGPSGASDRERAAA